jgi:hypothetical protein
MYVLSMSFLFVRICLDAVCVYACLCLCFELAESQGDKYRDEDTYTDSVCVVCGLCWLCPRRRTQIQSDCPMIVVYGIVLSNYFLADCLAFGPILLFFVFSCVVLCFLLWSCLVSRHHRFVVLSCLGLYSPEMMKHSVVDVEAYNKVDLV